MDRTRETVVGVFDNPEQARDAIDALKNAGFDPGDISLLMPQHGDGNGHKVGDDKGKEIAKGAGAGLAAGGILGGLAGWLVGVGALAIPGVGPIIAAGALGTALSGAAVGAGVGAIAGALVRMGVPEDEAKAYEDEVRAGRTLVVVRAGARVDEAWRLLRASGARDVQQRGDGGEPVRRAPEDRADVTMPGTSPVDIPERTTADVTERADR
jgi:rhodanese-related sulfurtransferase